MSWISSRKKACDHCGKRMLLCDVVNIEGVNIDMCVSCAKAFISEFEQWKANKDAKKEESIKKAPHKIPSSKEGTCQFCGHSVDPGVIGLSVNMPKHICETCLYNKIKELMK